MNKTPKIAPSGTRAVNCAVLLLAAMAMLYGCAALPEDYLRTPSTAFQDYASTTIGKRMEEMAATHPGQSGFAIIRYPGPAFLSRIILTELAQKSLDIQYYIWEADATGRILAERLVRAADRGVRVRILVDDMNLAGRDAAIAVMDAHPNIEIRIFNPFAHRDSRLFDFFSDLSRVNHRMHNKVMVADNAVAIVGGRNIGNHYFGVDVKANFRDLDIAAAGPVVRKISNVFDVFWNGDWSVPIAALVDRSFTEEDLKEAMAKVPRLVAEGNFPHPLDQSVAALKAELDDIIENFIWAPGKIIWDDPAAIYDDSAQGIIKERLHEKIPTLRQDLLVESAYFVPRKRGVDVARKLNERGVRVRILTNSLISNDVLAAHAGYAEYREELLKTGTELYELRPDAGAVKKPDLKQKNVLGESNAALHTKAMVFDRESVFIGSFNLDPRSADINTEAGLYVESPALAEQVIDYMDEGVKLENCYRVSLDEEGDLVWVTEIEGEEVRYDRDPGSSFWQRFKSGFIELLPVQGQL